MGVIGFPTLVLAGFVIKLPFGECISKISRKDAITKTIKYCSSLFTIHFEKVISQWVASNHCLSHLWSMVLFYTLGERSKRNVAQK